jgi:phosphate-selective porin OprO/OprP
VGATLLVATVPLGGAQADADPRDQEIRALRALVDQLDQRLRVLEAERAAAPPTAAAPIPSPAADPAAARLTVDERGFSLASGDEAWVLRLHGLMQADGRWYPGANDATAPDTWLVRRARLGADGRLGRGVEFQITPEFAGSAATLLDASATFTWFPAAHVQFGRFKAPVGLEQLQSDSRAFFAERAFPTQLMPNRDVGVMVHGDLADQRFHYAIGVFNGVGDGGSATTTDSDDHKDFVARVFMQPFRHQPDSVWSGLGLGLGAATGRQTGAAGLTSGYRTDGQQSLFRFRNGTVAAGRVTRFSPQASWFHGPVGVLAEYAESRAEVALPAGNAAATLRQSAWQIAAGWVLTGEDASYRGVVPRTPFDPARGAWGAWELTARFSRLELDAGVFPVFADPAASAQGASALGVGVNWHLSRNLRATLDYFRTDFDPAPGAPAVPTNPVLLDDEHAVISRLQVAF